MKGEQTEADLLLLTWWNEDGWARPEARYAVETREYLQARRVLGETGRLTERGRALVMAQEAE